MRKVTEDESEGTDSREITERDQTELCPCFVSEGKESQAWSIFLAWTTECWHPSHSLLGNVKFQEASGHLSGHPVGF